MAKKTVKFLERGGFGVGSLAAGEWTVFAEGGCVFDDETKIAFKELGTVSSFSSFSDFVVSDRCLSDLLDCFPNLRSLQLGNACELTLASSTSLKRWHDLRSMELSMLTVNAGELLGDSSILVDLNLSQSEIDSTDTSILVSLFPNLRRLILRGTSIRNEGIQHLTELKFLVAIDLSDCGIDDNCFNALAELPNLQMLLLRNTQITAGAAEKFAAKFKNCLVVIGDGIDDCYLNEDYWDEQACVSQFSLNR